MAAWIDAHAHLSDPRWRTTLPALLEEAREAGIGRFVLGGLDPEDWERQREIAREHPGVVVPAFGLHPWRVAERPEIVADGLRRLREELARADRVCQAIGETGLDRHSRFAPETYVVQETSFRAHLDLAGEFALPLVLHIVRAHDRALAILRETAEKRRIESSPGSRPFRGIVHSFSGDLVQARAYLALGLTPSISAPVITRGSGTAFEKLKAAVVTLGATEFVIETDAPDQPPAGEAGPNRLTNLLRVAEVVARFRGVAPTEVLDQSARTVSQIFSPP